MPITKIRSEEIRKINGFDIIVKYIDMLEYNGLWHHDSYKAFLGLKYIGNYIGYPTDSDLKKLINKEVCVRQTDNNI